MYVCLNIHMCIHIYVAYQPPLSMDFSRQEYWSGLTFPSPVHIYIYIYKFVNNVQIHTYN